MYDFEKTLLDSSSTIISFVVMSKRSEIGHADLPFNCPHTNEFISQLINKLNLPNNASIIDIGCGRGELLCRLVELTDGYGVALDNNSSMLDNIRLPSKGTITKLCCDRDIWLNDINANNMPHGQYDMIICIGSLSVNNKQEMLKKIVILY